MSLLMKRKTLLLSILSILSFGMLTTSVFASKQNISIVYGYTTGDAETYYNGISSSLTGSSLLTKLQELNSAKRRTLISYNSMFSYFSKTDPGTSSGKVTSFYTGKNCTSVTREHIWPYSKLVLNDHTGNSRGDNDIEKDLQMIRPADSSINEDRGNSFYTMPDGQGYDPGGLGDETYRGEAARIIFYCVVADGNLSLVDRDYDSWQNHTMGKLSDLLRWNIQYSITNREKVRNEAVEGIQGHRNPFVDHPEYACKIWGNTNTLTNAICKEEVVSREKEVEDLYLGDHDEYLEVGDNLSLNAYIEPYDLTGEVGLTWTTSNSEVATVVNGFVTAVGLGETTITVSTKPTGYKTASCVIKVVEDKTNIGGEDNPPPDNPPPVTPDPPKSNSSNGCGGNIITTSVILSTLSLLGISLILIRKFKPYEK